MKQLLLTFSALAGLGFDTAQAQNQPLNSSTNSTVCSAPCIYGEPGYHIEFGWPDIQFEAQVLATVIVQINTVAGFTTTTTTYGTATSVSGASASGYVTDITSFWNSKMGVTDIVVENGTPTLTYKPHVYTAPGEYITVTTVLPSPSDYFNMGFLAYTADYTLSGIETDSYTDGLVETYTDCSAGSTSSTFALTPTVTPSGFSDPYLAPVGVEDWRSMVPASIQSDCISAGIAFPAVAQVYVSALTATTTQYDDYVHSQSKPSSPAKQPASATPQSKTKATTTSLGYGNTNPGASTGQVVAGGPTSSAANAKSTGSPAETGKASGAAVATASIAGSGTVVQPATYTGSASTTRQISTIIAWAAGGVLFSSLLASI